MLEFEDSLLEQYEEDGAACPLLRLNRIDLPPVEIAVGGRQYRYERSYPIKGHGPVMPRFLREQIEAGKEPLLVERFPRFYIYLARA